MELTPVPDDIAEALATRNGGEMTGVTVKIKIAGVPKDYPLLPFGRQIEHGKKIQEFQQTAQTTHISQKRRSAASAWREFVKLYQPTEYYAKFHDTVNCRDDSYQVWYK